MHTDATATPKPEATLLQQILGLIIVGEYLATFVALVPLLLLIGGRDMAGHTGDVGGVFWIIGGFASAWWLKLLENYQCVRITTPLIPIPLIWFTPLLVIGGLSMLL